MAPNVVAFQLRDVQRTDRCSALLAGGRIEPSRGITDTSPPPVSQYFNDDVIIHGLRIAGLGQTGKSEAHINELLGTGSDQGKVRNEQHSVLAAEVLEPDRHRDAPIPNTQREWAINVKPKARRSLLPLQLKS